MSLLLLVAAVVACFHWGGEDMVDSGECRVRQVFACVNRGGRRPSDEEEDCKGTVERQPMRSTSDMD